MYVFVCRLFRDYTSMGQRTINFIYKTFFMGWWRIKTLRSFADKYWSRRHNDGNIWGKPARWLWPKKNNYHSVIYSHRRCSAQLSPERLCAVSCKVHLWHSYWFDYCFNFALLFGNNSFWKNRSIRIHDQFWNSYWDHNHACSWSIQTCLWCRW